MQTYKSNCCRTFKLCVKRAHLQNKNNNCICDLSQEVEFDKTTMYRPTYNQDNIEKCDSANASRRINFKQSLLYLNVIFSLNFSIVLQEILVLLLMDVWVSRV